MRSTWMVSNMVEIESVCHEVMVVACWLARLAEILYIRFGLVLSVCNGKCSHPEIVVNWCVLTLETMLFASRSATTEGKYGMV